MKHNESAFEPSDNTRVRVFMRIAAMGGLFAGCSTGAFAAPPVGAPVDPTFISVANSIEASLDAMLLNQGLADIGWALFSFFVIANLVYLLIKNIVTGGGINGAITDAVPLVIMGAVVVGFLSRGLAEAIDATMKVITSAVAGEDVGSIAQLMVTAAGKSLQAIRNLWDLSPTTDVMNVGGLASIGAILAAIPVSIYKFMATIVGVFFIAVTLAIYLAHLVMSQMGIYIALLMAPIFTPFLLFSPMSWLFDGWLRFFLGASMLKIVGLLLMQISNQVMDGVLKLSETVQASGQVGVIDGAAFDIVKYCAIVLLSGLLALMMSQASSMATGLISGNGGGASFGGWSQLASKSLGARSIMGGMSMGKVGSGGQAANALSGVTNAVPLPLKPVTAAVGAAVSARGGRTIAMKDASSAKTAVNGERPIGRDLSKMDRATASKYQATLQRMNAQTAARESSPTFYGPPTPRYTITQPTSSTTPSPRKR